MPAKVLDHQASISGHVWLYEGKRRKTWYAKWRDQAGQHEKALGPHWSGKGAPPPGFLRKREAQALLEEILVDARRGQLRQQRTSLTFAQLCQEWYEYGCYQRDWSPATRRDYRSVLDVHLVPAFGPKRPEAITGRDVERLRDRLACETSDGLDGQPEEVRGRRTVNKIMTQLHGVLQFGVRHHKLIKNVADEVDLLEDSYDAARFDFYSPQEIDLIYATALAGRHRSPRRPAKTATEQALREEEDRQDAIMYLTAALTGLRLGELTRLLHWDDVDFEKACIRVWETPRAKDRRGKGKTERPRKPKSRKSRTVPMVEKVADALEDLRQRAHHTDRTDLVFISRYDGSLDSSALRRRYNATLKAAGLRRLRIHDLRHTFGSLAINVASIVQIQAWMGHADIKTTMRYLHHKSRADDARLLSTAFASSKP